MQLMMVALAPSLLWLWWFWKQDVHPEKTGPMARAFFFGGLAVVPAGILERSLPQLTVHSSLWHWVLVVGLVEEFFKYLAACWAVNKEPGFDEPFDGIVFAAAASLGFAFVENLGYFATANGAVMIIRSLLSVPGHVLNAVPWGAAMGMRRCIPGTWKFSVAAGLVISSFLHGADDWLLTHFQTHTLAAMAFFVSSFLLQWYIYKRLTRSMQAPEYSCIREPAPVPEAAAGACAPVREIPEKMVSAESKARRTLRWEWVAATFVVGCFIFVVMCFALHPWVVGGSFDSHRGQATALLILALIFSGFISSFLSPGRTMLESALGLSVLGGLLGLLPHARHGTEVGVVLTLMTLGAFGGWLGEACQSGSHSLRLFAPGRRGN